MDKHGGNPLPEETLASIRDTGVALKGPITTPIGTGFRSVNVALRHELNLYACLRPCKTYPGVRTRYEAVDVVIVRENTEDLYAGIEFESGSEAAEELIATLGRLQPKQLNAEVRHLDQAPEPGGVRADHPLRLRVRAGTGPPRRPLRDEGEHHEAHGRALPRGLPARRRRVRRHRATREPRRRDLHGPRAAAGGVRRARAPEPLRRHRVRSRRRPRRRPGRRARREHRRRRSGLRGHARLRAEVPRPEQGQPDRDDPLREAHARASRASRAPPRGWRRPSPRSSPRARASRTT